MQICIRPVQGPGICDCCCCCWPWLCCWSWCCCHTAWWGPVSYEWLDLIMRLTFWPLTYPCCCPLWPHTPLKAKIILVEYSQDIYPCKVSKILSTWDVFVHNLQLNNIRQRRSRDGYVLINKRVVYLRSPDSFHVNRLIVHCVIIVKLNVVDARGPVNVCQLECNPASILIIS